MTSFLAHLSHDCHASRWGMQQGSHGYMLLPSKVEHPNQGRKKKTLYSGPDYVRAESELGRVSIECIELFFKNTKNKKNVQGTTTLKYLILWVH